MLFSLCKQQIDQLFDTINVLMFFALSYSNVAQKIFEKFDNILFPTLLNKNNEGNLFTYL